MARDKTAKRADRHYATDAPPRRRVQEEPLEYSDGFYLAREVSAYEILPRAKTVRQLRKRAQILKGGSYGDGTTIAYPLSEAEKLLLNSMGAAEPVAQD